jgi:hypothetical protein
MYLSHMSSEISLLGECILANFATEGSKTCMSAEMILQVARLLEATRATWVVALIEMFVSLGLFIVQI